VVPDDGVTSSKVKDGALSGKDVGRFAGTLTALDFGTIAKGSCKAITSTSLTPVVGSGAQDLRDDVIAITPSSGFPLGSVTINAEPAAANQITVAICNIAGTDPINIGAQNFRYVSIDVSGA
jgi:hypothetical protein